MEAPLFYLYYNVVRDYVAVEILAVTLFLWKGAGGIARTGGYIKMMYNAAGVLRRRLVKQLFFVGLSPGPSARLPLPEEGALRGSVVVARLEEHGDEMCM